MPKNTGFASGGVTGCSGSGGVTGNSIKSSSFVQEAHKFSKENGYNHVDYWYLAAEVTNKDGDTNPAVWNMERAEAIKRLKTLL